MHVAVVLSDMHIGKGDKLDEFSQDESFDRLLQEKSRQHPQDNVDVVLLGDIIDLWRVVPDKESNPESASDIVLEFPVKNPGELKTSVKRIKGLITEVFKKHPKIPDAIQKFLLTGKNRKIVYVTGNHDHALVHPGIAEHVEHELLEDNYEKLNDRLDITRNYEARDLGIYAEHGNQYEKFCRYEDFASPEFREEPPAYYFTKLFSNRMGEAFSELHKKGISIIKQIKKLRKFPEYSRFYTQYVFDPRVPREKVIYGTSEDRIGQLNPNSHNPLEHTADTVISAFFNGKGRVKELLKGKRLREVIPKMFLEKGYPALRPEGNLVPDVHNIIITGHTHSKMEMDVNVGQKTVKYFNTGAWQGDSGENPYVEVYKSNKGRVIAHSHGKHIGCRG